MDKMEEDKKDILIEACKGLPALLTIVSGSPAAIVAGFLGLTAQGVEYFRKMNKELLAEYFREAEVPNMIEDDRKSAENIQFMREWIMKIIYETREEKRKRYLNIALNYHKKNIAFDEKILFLNLLDRLSEEELIRFLQIYSSSRLTLDTVKGVSKIRALDKRLDSYGLLDMNLKSFEDALRKIENQLNYVRGEGGDLNSARYNFASDGPKLEYQKTSLGYRFFDFLQRDQTERKNLNK